MSGRLTIEQRVLLNALADVLIPEAEDMPSAGEVDVAGSLMDKAMNYRPDLFVPLRRALAKAETASDLVSVCKSLESEDAEAWSALGLLVSWAYYRSEAVRAITGYLGQQRREIDPDDVPPYVSDQLLDRVRMKGRIWRDPDELLPDQNNVKRGTR